MSEGLQPAYVLHARDYRDTSQILELLTAEQGRMPVVTRGSRGARSKLRGRLQPFAPLLVGSVGKGELRTATTVDFAGPAWALSGDALLLGLYVNELLYRLLGKYEAVPLLYQGYHQLMDQLQQPADALLAVRRFELLLLQELGYAISFDYDAGTGVAVDAGSHYAYVVHEGFYQTDQVGENIYNGAELVAISRGDLMQIEERRLRYITRLSLAELLGERPLKSRSLFQGGGR